MIEAVKRGGFAAEDMDCEYMEPFQPLFPGQEIDYQNPKKCKLTDLPDGIELFYCYPTGQKKPIYEFHLETGIRIRDG